MDQSLDTSLPTLRYFFDSEKINTDSVPMHRDDKSKTEEGSSDIPLSHYLKTLQSRATEPEAFANWKNHKKYQSCRETGKLGSSKRYSGERHPSDGFIEVCLNSDGKQEDTTQYIGPGRTLAPRFQKSYSTRLQIPFLAAPSEIVQSTKSSLRSQFRKRFGSFINFNSRSEAKIGENMVHGTEMISKEPAFQKSLLNDLLHMKRKDQKPKSRFVKQDQREKGLIESSPVHLRGRLKLENRQGLQVLYFILDSPRDVYIAKLWKSDNTHCWVYTFCSANKESSTVAWMQVSYGTSSEPREFVLYNITHAQESCMSTQESLTRSNSFKQTYEKTEFHVSALCPSAGLEMAAIVIQEPAEHKKEKGISGKKLKVVIPSGIHGFQDAERDVNMPSTLLQRWKLGGGCDCGGWDMACPLFILTSSENQELVEDQNLLKLFFEGTKESGSAALTMAFIRGKNMYEVSFHAQLSALQAFSICVAALHKPPKQRSETTLLRCDSLKELMDLEEEKQHVRKEFRFVKESSASFMPSVTFSPIAIV